MYVLTREEKHKEKVDAALRTIRNTIEHQVSHECIVTERQTPKVTKDGGPCDSKKRNRVKQFAVTILSKKVPLEVADMRNSKCEVCPHKSESKDHWWCECCRCPKWALSDCRNKNRYSRHFCPIGEFGVYTNDT